MINCISFFEYFNRHFFFSGIVEKKTVTRISRVGLSLIFMIATCFGSYAQNKYKKSDNGFVIYKLGTDTTTLQYFEFNNGKFVTTILSLNGQVTKLEGTGELDNKGAINTVRSKTYRLDNTEKWALVSEGLHEYKGDSSIYTSSKNGEVVIRRTIPAKGIVSNVADPCSFFMFPYMSFFAPEVVSDTSKHCQLVFGSCRPYYLTRISKNEIHAGSGVMGNIKLFPDKNNKLVKADAVGSSLNFIATVERERKNYLSLIDAVAKHKNSNASYASSTKRDTTVLTVNGSNIEIDYWRPQRRNREIFGKVVPWNRIWRTGANNATQLRTETNLQFGENKLQSGKYSIWTFPTEQGWQLIINKNAAVWGTEYNASADLFKVPLTVEKVNMPVDTLTISLKEEGKNVGRLLIEWEYYRAWIDFKTN